MAEKGFEPIGLNANAPGGEGVLRTFDDIGFFMLKHLEPSLRLQPHWQSVRKELPQARFGARQLETLAAMRAALAAEGWLRGDGANIKTTRRRLMDANEI